MAVTTYDITYTEVLETIGHSDQDSASPGTAVITKWITRFSAYVNLALRKGS